jgi:purine-binding chemotaxis protein CheW
MDFLEIRRKAKERAARAAAAATPRPPEAPATRDAPPAEVTPAPPDQAPPPAPGGVSDRGSGALPARPLLPVRSPPGSPEARRLEAEVGTRVATLPHAPDSRFVTWRPDGDALPELAMIGPLEGDPRLAVGGLAGSLALIDPLDDFFYRDDEAAPRLDLLAALPVDRDQLAQVALEEYLTFQVEGQTYAVEIGRVLEVMRTPPITEVPRAPPDVLGVISVRGEVITIVDPRGRLGLTRTEGPPARRVVIVDDGAGACGLLVDGVAGVVRLPRGALEPCPQTMGAAGGEQFLGIGRERERLFLVLDLAAMLRPLRGAAEARPG